MQSVIFMLRKVGSAMLLPVASFLAGFAFGLAWKVPSIGALWQQLTQTHWFGDAFGAAIGLVALALAAFLNARLNRSRDERLRRQEVAGVRAALGTELRAYSKTLADRFGYLNLIAERDSIPNADQLVERLYLPEPIIYPSLAPSMGLLDPTEATATTFAWHGVSLARNLLSAALVNIRQGNVDLDLTKKRAGFGLDAAASCARAADRLLGPEVFSTPREATAAEMREILSGRTGGEWRRYQREEHERQFGRTAGAPESGGA